MSFPKLQLLWPHLLVRPDQLPSSVGKIILPEARAQRPVSGLIIDVGPGLEDNYSDGDRVIFAEYAGHSFTIDKENLLILNPSEVLGRIVGGGELC